MRISIGFETEIIYLHTLELDFFLNQTAFAFKVKLSVTDERNEKKNQIRNYQNKEH